MNPNQYRSVDDVQAQTTLEEAAAKCNVTVEVHGTGRQVRLDCPFKCEGDHAGKRELSVDTGNPQKVFACHAYQCQVRGNLLSGKVTLLFDADDAGDDGVKETLWLLAQRRLDVQLGWSRAMHGGRFAGRQPENLAAEEWMQMIVGPIKR